MSAIARSSVLRAARSSTAASATFTARSVPLWLNRSFASSSRMAAAGATGGGVNGDEPLVKFSSEGSARIYTLNRPKKLNSLNHEMITALSEQLRTWRESDLCKLIIGLGNERSFCAGGDVAQLAKDVRYNKDTGIKFFKDEFETNWLMAHLNKPYIAVIDGITMGGGAGIALPAPIRIATSRTTFAMPETAIGYAPDVGVNYYLAQLDGSIGAWLAITGQSIYGRTVYELGIATHYVAPSALPSILRELADHPKPTLSNISALVSSHTAPYADGPGSKQNPDGSTPLTPAVRAFLDETFALNSLPEIHGALARAAGEGSQQAADVQKWAGEQLKIINERSPTGMAVALEGLRKARQAKRLNDVLKNDMSMATAFCSSEGKRESNDFVTGVTHLLIDKVKGQRAAWDAEIDSSTITPSAIQRFFTKDGKHHASVPSLALNPKPAPVPIEGGKNDAQWGRWRAYGLPTEREMRDYVRGDARGSGSNALRESDLVERVLGSKRGRESRVAVDEVKRAVRSAVERKCSADVDGFLTWRFELREEVAAKERQEGEADALEKSKL